MRNNIQQISKIYSSNPSGNFPLKRNNFPQYPSSGNYESVVFKRLQVS